MKRTSMQILEAEAAAYAAGCKPANRGERNKTAFNVAGHLRSFITKPGDLRLTEQQILNLMVDWNQRLDEPLSERELRDAVHSAWKENGTPREDHVVELTRSRKRANRRGNGEAVRQIGRWRPFPIESLPSVLRSYIVPVAERMDCDPALLISPAISVFAGAVGNSVKVVVRHGWVEPCALWTGLIALPGSMKTQTQEAATAPVYEAQRRADADFNAEYVKYEHDLAEWEVLRKKNSNEPKPPKPSEPIRQQSVITDATPEAVVQVLSGNPRGTIALYDELGLFFGGLGRYAKNTTGSEAGAAFYKSAFNGRTHIENRKGENGRGRYLRIESPLISVSGAIQPDALRRLLTRQYVEDGLASRFLWAMPPDRPGGWPDERADDPLAVAEYGETYRRLCAIPLNIGEDGKLHPVYLGLTEPAQAFAAAWVNRLRGAIADAPDPAVRAAWAKVKGIAFRFALLFHLIEWAASGSVGDIGPIGIDTLERAVAVTEWFQAEAVRVYAMLGETEDEADDRELIEWVERRGGAVTARDLTRGPRRFRSRPDLAEAVLTDLVKRGIGAWDHRQEASVFLLHPGNSGDGDTKNSEGNRVAVTSATPQNDEWGIE